LDAISELILSCNNVLVHFFLVPFDKSSLKNKKNKIFDLLKLGVGEGDLA
jgi:hypothetical protein